MEHFHCTELKIRKIAPISKGVSKLWKIQISPKWRKALHGLADMITGITAVSEAVSIYQTWREPKSKRAIIQGWEMWRHSGSFLQLQE